MAPRMAKPSDTRKKKQYKARSAVAVPSSMDPAGDEAVAEGSGGSSKKRKRKTANEQEKTANEQELATKSLTGEAVLRVRSKRKNVDRLFGVHDAHYWKKREKWKRAYDLASDEIKARLDPYHICTECLVRVKVNDDLTFTFPPQPCTITRDPLAEGATGAVKRKNRPPGVTCERCRKNHMACSAQVVLKPFGGVRPPIQVLRGWDQHIPHYRFTWLVMKERIEEGKEPDSDDEDKKGQIRLRVGGKVVHRYQASVVEPTEIPHVGQKLQSLEAPLAQLVQDMELYMK